MKIERENRETQAYWMMSRPVETVRVKDSLREVAYLFTEKNIGAAAVLDENEKPVGVITKTDLARYEKQRDGLACVDKREAPLNGESKRTGFHAFDDGEAVEHWMTPVIFSVKPETQMKEIARRMVRYGIHHIFIRGTNGDPLVGIVSSFDILRKVAAIEVDADDRKG